VAVSRGQALLSITALGVAILVITIEVLLADHQDVVITALRLGGAALLSISAALMASILPPARESELARLRARR
jgi:hypothetical protein